MNFKSISKHTEKALLLLLALLTAVFLLFSLTSCEGSEINGSEPPQVSPGDTSGGASGENTENNENNVNPDNEYPPSEPNDPYENDKHWELQ